MDWLPDAWRDRTRRPMPNEHTLQPPLTTQVAKYERKSGSLLFEERCDFLQSLLPTGTQMRQWSLYFKIVFFSVVHVYLKRLLLHDTFIYSSSFIYLLSK